MLPPSLTTSEYYYFYFVQVYSIDILFQHEKGFCDRSCSANLHPFFPHAVDYTPHRPLPSDAPELWLMDRRLGTTCRPSPWKPQRVTPCSFPSRWLEAWEPSTPGRLYWPLRGHRWQTPGAPNHQSEESCPPARKQLFWNLRDPGTNLYSVWTLLYFECVKVIKTTLTN